MTRAPVASELSVSRFNRLLWSKPSRIRSYGVVLLSTASALIISRWMFLHLGASPGTLFLCAVMLSAWFGGVGPGLLASALSAFAFHYVFLPPMYSLGPKPGEIPKVFMYIIANLIIGLLSAAQRNAKESLRRARDDLKRTVQDLERTNEALQAESRERKQTEEALRQAQADLARANRVSSMGELTASLAHEVKQPIAAAITDANTCLRWLSRDQPDLEEARAAASRIVQDGRRAGEIVNRISLLFKKDTLQRELVDLNQVIEEMTLLLHGQAAKLAASVRTELAANLPPVSGDRIQLQQVLMNLMMNSIDAITDVEGPANSLSSHSAARMVKCWSQSAIPVLGFHPSKRTRSLMRFLPPNPRHGHGTADQSLHCGIAWWPLVGCRQPAARRKILFLITHCSRDTRLGCVGRSRWTC